MSKGGTRQGAGRPNAPDDLKKEQITVRLSRYVIKWLKKHKNQGKTIEEALIEKHDIEEPKKP